jgi:hypothetical protein
MHTSSLSSSVAAERRHGHGKNAEQQSDGCDMCVHGRLLLLVLISASVDAIDLTMSGCAATIFVVSPSVSAGW